MELTNRFGSTVEEGSSRAQTTEEAGALPALSEMNTRPAFVAAQTVPVLLGARSIAAMKLANAFPPRRSPPYAALVRSVMPDAPSRTKSPHVGVDAAVVNSGQLAS